MKTILVTGANGQVGWELRRTLAPLGRVVAPSSSELDLADPDAIRRVTREVRPHLIVNPAGTNGTRFLLTTVGVEVDSPQTKTELEKKDIQVRDALISILTSKGLDQLGRIDQRDLLRSEIAQKIGDLLTSGKPKNVYFGKFIIQ